MRISVYAIKSIAETVLMCNQHSQIDLDKLFVPYVKRLGYRRSSFLNGVVSTRPT